MSIIDSTVVVALIALIGTLVVAFKDSGKQTKADAIIMEHRITVLEEAITNQLKPLYEAIEKNFTLFLQKTTTPDLDVLLQKYHDSPSSMTEDELIKMLGLIEVEMAESVSDESGDKGRAIGLTFLSVAIKDRLRMFNRRKMKPILVPYHGILNRIKVALCGR